MDNTIGLTEFQTFYNKYVKDNELGDEYKLSPSRLSKIVKTYHKIVKKKLLYDNLVFNIPVLRFRIRIGKVKRVMFNKDGKLRKHVFAVDWKTTRELWNNNPEFKEKKKVVYHLNDHSDGYIYKIKMVTGTSKVKYNYFMKYKSARDMSRELASIIKDPYNKIDYYEL